nr:type II toxin-antitoxin system RelE/ParE family toxin [uncultured Gellertiella sp.]
MTDEEITSLVSYLAENPEAGNEIKGTGGCRKLRYAISANNKGKSGGVRVITFFSGQHMPIFLVAAFGKSAKVSLTKAERNMLRSVTEEIVKAYATRVTRLDVKVGATA